MAIFILILTKSTGCVKEPQRFSALEERATFFLFFFLIRGIYYNLILFTWTLIKYRALQDLQPFILPHIFCCCNPPVVDTAKLIEPCMIFCKSKLLSHTGSKAPIEMSAHWNYNLMSSFLAAAFTYQLCLTAITESGRKKNILKKSVSVWDKGQLPGDTEWCLLIRFGSQALWLLLLLSLFYYFCYRTS